MSNRAKIRQYRNTLESVKYIINQLETTNKTLLQSIDSLQNNLKIDGVSAPALKVKSVQSDVSNTSHFLSNSIIPAIYREIERLSRED